MTRISRLPGTAVARLRSTTGRQRAGAGLAVVVAMVLVAVLFGSGHKRQPQAHRVHHAAIPTATATPVPTPVPTPAAVPVGFTPPPTGGYRVKVAELGINLPVVHGDGVNVALFTAAQFPALAPPGSGSRSLIYAHAQPGMFGDLLDRGAVGQHVEVDLPNGHVAQYVIRQYYRRWPVADTRWLLPVQHEELILVTCTSFNLSEPRVVAVAEPI